MIRCKGLVKLFNGKAAVDNVSFEAEDGTIMALLGPNGAGKTTIVRMLTCVIPPTSGEAWIAGLPIKGNEERIKSIAGVLTETPSLYDRMDVRSYLNFFASLYGIPPDERKSRIERFLDLFELSGQEGKRIGNFSKGMKQKVALARALIHDPRVIFLDEPTSGLDPESAKTLRDYILYLKGERKRTILLCTHNLDEAQRLSDVIGIIDKGRILRFGRSEELMANNGTREFTVRIRGTPPLEPGAIEGIRGVSGVHLSRRGNETVVIFSTKSPEVTNPALLARLLSQDLPVIACEETTRPLERIYLESIKGERGILSGEKGSDYSLP